MIKSILQEVWETLENEELKEIYQPAYDLAKERFSQEKVYFPSAATPAAKIISLALTEPELFEIGILMSHLICSLKLKINESTDFCRS